MKKYLLIILCFFLLGSKAFSQFSLPILEGLLGNMVGAEAAQTSAQAAQAANTMKSFKELQQMYKALKQASEMYNKVSNVVRTSKRLARFFEVEQLFVVELYNTSKSVEYAENNGSMNIYEIKGAYERMKALKNSNSYLLKELKASVSSSDTKMTDYERIQMINNSLSKAEYLLLNARSMSRIVNKKILRQNLSKGREISRDFF